MKTYIKNVFFLPMFITALLLMLAGYANAQEGNYDGFYWDFIGNNAVKITGYYGTNGAAAIPSTVPYKTNNFTVTIINGYAFSEIQRLTSVTIPNSVTNIEFDAFLDSTNLTSVTGFTFLVQSMS
jgi:hypothetical protein